MLTEDELLERADGWSEPDPPARADHEPRTTATSYRETMGPASRAANSGARATLVVSLGAAALVGFAVWELLGVAAESTPSHNTVAHARPPVIASPVSPHIHKQPIRSSQQPKAARTNSALRAQPRAARTAVNTATASQPVPQPASLRPTITDAPGPSGAPRAAGIEFGFER